MNLSISNSRRLLTVFFAALIGALFLLVLASEWLVRVKVMPQDTFTRHVTLFETTHSPYVAFGDSHVARGFNAEAPVVNLAYPSENLDQIAWKAERYIKNTPYIKAVLIQADPHMFSVYRSNAERADYPQEFTNVQPLKIQALTDRYRPQLLQFWRAFIKNGGHLRSTIEATPQGALLSPGNVAEWTTAKTDEFTQYRAGLHKVEGNVRESKFGTQYLDMVQRFVDHGAKVCLVSFPTSPPYRERILGQDVETKKAWNETISFFQDIAADPNVTFIDDRARFSDLNLFRDPDHLNIRGATLYGPIVQSACFGEIEG